MKASPGPITRKKPAARSHMDESARKRCVSVLKMKTLRASAFGLGSFLAEELDKLGKERVPYSAVELSWSVELRNRGLSSRKPLRSSSSTASAMISSSLTTRSATAPIRDTANSKALKNRKNR